MIDEKTWRDNDVLFNIQMPDGVMWDGDMHARYLLSLVQRFLFYPTSTGLDVTQVPTHRALVHCHAGIGRTGMVIGLLAAFSPSGQGGLTTWRLIMQLRYSRLSAMIFTVAQWAYVLQLDCN